jgi:hypothetical protein
LVIEAEAASIRYVTELVGAGTDSERAIRWLIALMVLCCDPLYRFDGRGIGPAIIAAIASGPNAPGCINE